MKILSSISLENNIYIMLSLDNSKLEYILEYEDDKEDYPSYDNFNVYVKNDNGTIKYKDIHYKKITNNSILKNKKLTEGFYLFIFNKTKLFVEFINNKITYEIEDIGIENIEDLS